MGAGRMVLVGRTDPEEASRMVLVDRTIEGADHMGRAGRKAEGADRNPEEAAHIQAEEDIDPSVGRNPGVGTDPKEDIDP